MDLKGRGFSLFKLLAQHLSERTK